MGKPELEFTFTCGCGRIRKMKARYMYRGKRVRCTCGREIVISDNGFIQAQREIDRFTNQLKRLSRR